VDPCPTSFPPTPDPDGDFCNNDDDDDDDGDGVLDIDDSCPTSYLPNAPDRDGDGCKDSEDDDIDGDGFLNDDDPCPLDGTTDTFADFDQDGCPNYADDDTDNDGVPDTDDACNFTPFGSPDYDGDGCEDTSDADKDDDGIFDYLDACVYSPLQQPDLDQDGCDDANDDDDDGDGVYDDEEPGLGLDPRDADSDDDGHCDGLPKRPDVLDCMGPLVVRADAAAGGDGKTWATAFNSLVIINQAAENHIWVAEGTYTSPAPTWRSINEDVRVLGGFVGDERYVEQWSPRPEATILDAQGSQGPFFEMAAGSTLSSFTLRNGGPAGPGSYASLIDGMGTGEISHLIIEEATTSFNGLDARDAAVVEHLLFRNNDTPSGVLLKVRGEASDITFVGNTGGKVMTGSCRLDRFVFAYNHIDDQYLVRVDGPAQWSQSMWLGNQADTAPGITLTQRVTGLLSDPAPYSGTPPASYNYDQHFDGVRFIHNTGGRHVIHGTRHTPMHFHDVHFFDNDTEHEMLRLNTTAIVSGGWGFSVHHTTSRDNISWSTAANDSGIVTPNRGAEFQCVTFANNTVSASPSADIRPDTTVFSARPRIGNSAFINSGYSTDHRPILQGAPAISPSPTVFWDAPSARLSMVLLIQFSTQLTADPVASVAASGEVFFDATSGTHDAGDGPLPAEVSDWTVREDGSADTGTADAAAHYNPLAASVLSFSADATSALQWSAQAAAQCTVYWEEGEVSLSFTDQLHGSTDALVGLASSGDDVGLVCWGTEGAPAGAHATVP